MLVKFVGLFTRLKLYFSKYKMTVEGYDCVNFFLFQRDF